MVKKSYTPAGSYVPIEIPTGAGFSNHPQSVKLGLF